MPSSPQALTLALALVLSGCVVASSEAPEPTPSVSTSSSGSSSRDYAALEASLEKAITGGSVALNTVEAVLVSVDGQPVISHYRNGRRPDAALHTWSVTKSVTSALIGIAISDGLIEGLDQRLPELLPAYRSRMNPELSAVTLRQLLSMSAGFIDERQNGSPFGSALDDDDTVAHILDDGLVEPPGTAFGYSNNGAHLVTAVLATALQRADGRSPRSVLDYAEEKLFEPLGIDTRNAFSARVTFDEMMAFDRAGFGWGTDARGVHTGCCLLRLRPADLRKFGELYLNDGVWRGRRLLPEGWVATSTTPSEHNVQYGLMWWLSSTIAGPVYTARGAGGQLILVSPEDRLVAVVASNPTKDYSITDEDAYALVSETILPAFA